MDRADKIDINFGTKTENVNVVLNIAYHIHIYIILVN